MVDRKEFERRKARMREAMLRHKQFSPSTRLVGYFLADHIRHGEGYAWPSQEYLAALIGVTIRTIHRACIEIEYDNWFRRQLSGRNWIYIPNWLRLETPDKLSGVQCRNTGHNFREHRTFSTSNTGKKGDSILSTDYPNKRELTFGCEQHNNPNAPASNDEGSGNRERVVTTLANQSEARTKRAKRAGAPQFVFENSEPWRAWTEYRKAHGIPGALPTRQCMVNGRWRTGWDAPTLYPPGYSSIAKSRIV